MKFELNWIINTSLQTVKGFI